MESTVALAPAPEKRRRFNPFRVVGTVLMFVVVLLRVLVRKFITLIFLMLLVLGKNKAATAVGIVLGGLLIWSWSAFGGPFRPPEAVAQATGNPMLPASPYVQQFLQGRAAHDAAAVWDSFSDDLKAALARQNVGPDALQRQFQQEVRAGVEWVEATYVASTRLKDGKAVYLYIVTQKAPQASGQVPYTFTTSENGKIIRFD